MIDYDNSSWMCLLIPRLKGSAFPNALLVALPPSILCVVLMVMNEHMDDFEKEFGSANVTGSQLWAALTTVLMFSISFRTNKAYGRFWDGTTLLHQMRGEWFDAVSCLIAFSMLAKQAKPNEVADFRHAVVRLMSLCHGSALEEIQDGTETSDFEFLDMTALDPITLWYLRESKENLGFNRVEVVIHMMQTKIVHAQETGALKIPPPILSRVFQTISRGQVNLMNCKKIKSTLFPFPYVQAIALMLLILTVQTPIVMSGMFPQKHWGFIFTFIPIFSLAALNYTAGELEMPFGHDNNDLPLKSFQDEMNNSLMMLMRDENDHVVTVDKRSTKEYKSLLSSQPTKRLSMISTPNPLGSPVDDSEPEDQAQKVQPTVETKLGQRQPKQPDLVVMDVGVTSVTSPKPPVVATDPPRQAAPALSVPADSKGQAEMNHSFQELINHIASLAQAINKNTETIAVTMARDATGPGGLPGSLR